jgi:hypothetical protein
MHETPPRTGQPEALPRSVRLLQWLVIVLTASMIVGVITVVAVVVTRFPDMRAAVRPTPAQMAPDLVAGILPETLQLPAGMRALAVTIGADWLAVVAAADAEEKGQPAAEEILIFDRATGALRQRVALQRAAGD